MCCTGKNAPVGVKIVSEHPLTFMGNNSVQGCTLTHTPTAVYTEGTMQSLTLSENVADSAANVFLADVDDFQNVGNSWNKTETDSQKNQK